MAIPFNVEDNADYDEALLRQLFSDLCQTLQQIALFQRSRRILNASSARVQVPASTSRRSRSHRESESELLNSAVNLAMSLSPAGSQNELETILQPQNQSIPIRRRHRRRSRSEPSGFKELKPVKVSVSVEVTNEDWIQQEKSGESNSKKRGCGSESLFSKLVPAPLSGPLWTAVICVVGWHLLRTR